MVKVKLADPFRGTLTGTGYMWEYLLKCRGWNQLPTEKKYGLVRNDYKRWGIFRVTFPHVDPPVKLLLCSNEVEIMPD